MEKLLILLLIIGIGFGFIYTTMPDDIKVIQEMTELCSKYDVECD